MEAPEIILTLIPAPHDPPLKTPEYQAELRQFKESLNNHGLEVSFTFEVRESLRPDALGFILPTYLGDFAVKLAGQIGPPLIAGVAGYFHGRSGRKVRLKVGDIEVEAPTMKEVERLLDRIEEIQQRNQPKLIHEP